jgi:hypothetical protein
LTFCISRDATAAHFVSSCIARIAVNMNETLILENLREIMKKLKAVRLEPVAFSCGEIIMTTAASKAQILRQQAARNA